MADWVSIKAEYIATDISTRALAEKSSVSYASLRRRAEKEHWADERKTTERKISAKVAQKVALTKVALEVDRLTRLLNIGDNIAGKLEEATSKTPIENYDFRTYTIALKNLHDVAKESDQAAGQDTEDLTPLAALLGEPHE